MRMNDQIWLMRVNDEIWRFTRANETKGGHPLATALRYVDVYNTLLTLLGNYVSKSFNVMNYTIYTVDMGIL